MPPYQHNIMLLGGINLLSTRHIVAYNFTTSTITPADSRICPLYSSIFIRIGCYNHTTTSSICSRLCFITHHWFEHPKILPSFIQFLFVL